MYTSRSIREGEEQQLRELNRIGQMPERMLKCGQVCPHGRPTAKTWTQCMMCGTPACPYIRTLPPLECQCDE